MEKYYKNSISKAAGVNVKKQIFELSKNQREKLKNISQIVLAVLAVGGILSISVVAPNVLQLIPYAKKVKKYVAGLDSYEKNRKIVKSFYYLKQNNYITILPKGDNFEIKITQKGRKKIKLIQFEGLTIERPKVWDKLWWLVLADIPTKDYKSAADLLRRKLKDMEFYPLQRTVWVHPFDPRDELDFVSHYYGVSNFVTVMQVTKLDPDDEAKIKKFFKKKYKI